MLGIIAWGAPIAVLECVFASVAAAGYNEVPARSRSVKLRKCIRTLGIIGAVHTVVVLMLLVTLQKKVQLTDVYREELASCTRIQNDLRDKLKEALRAVELLKSQHGDAVQEVDDVRKVADRLLNPDAKSKRLDAYSGYNVVVDIANLAHVTNTSIGWPLTFSPPMCEQFKKTGKLTEVPAHVVSFVGLFNRGKTFIQNSLFNRTTRLSADIVATKGLSISSEVLENKNYLFIDSAGLQAPVSVNKDRLNEYARKIRLDSKNDMRNASSECSGDEEQIGKEDLAEYERLARAMLFREQRSTEFFVQDFIFELSNVVIVVVNDMTYTEQEFIQYIEDRMHKNNDEKSRQLFVIHNFRSVSSVEEGLAKWHSQVVLTYLKNVEDEKSTSAGVRSIDTGAHTRHLYLINDHSPEGGELHNPAVFRELHTWLRMLLHGVPAPVEFLSSLQTIGGAKLNDYFMTRESDPLTLTLSAAEPMTADCGGVTMLAARTEAAPLTLRDIEFDLFGHRRLWEPPFDIVEPCREHKCGDQIIYVDVSSFKDLEVVEDERHPRKFLHIVGTRNLTYASDAVVQRGRFRGKFSIRIVVPDRCNAQERKVFFPGGGVLVLVIPRIADQCSRTDNATCYYHPSATELLQKEDGPSFPSVALRIVATLIVLVLGGLMWTRSQVNAVPAPTNEAHDQAVPVTKETTASQAVPVSEEPTVSQMVFPTPTQEENVDSKDREGPPQEDKKLDSKDKEGQPQSSQSPPPYSDGTEGSIDFARDAGMDILDTKK